jgi:hypothetical protein
MPQRAVESLLRINNPPFLLFLSRSPLTLKVINEVMDG